MTFRMHVFSNVVAFSLHIMGLISRATRHAGATNIGIDHVCEWAVHGKDLVVKMAGFELGPISGYTRCDYFTDWEQFRIFATIETIFRKLPNIFL